MPLAEVSPRIAPPTPRLAPETGTTSDRRTTHRGNAGSDEVLHDGAFRWLATLPPDLKVLLTARGYPRIVNRIADLWGHCEYTRLHFQSLLIPRDGRGFPPEVRRELEALEHYYFEHLSGLPAILWNAVPVSPRRIPDGLVFPLDARNSEINILPLARGYAEPERFSTDPLLDPERGQNTVGRLQGLWRRSTGR